MGTTIVCFECIVERRTDVDFHAGKRYDRTRDLANWSV